MRGVVAQHEIRHGTPYTQVRWGKDGLMEWHPASELRSGFLPEYVVQDRPRSNIRNTLGVATVRVSRQIAGRDMVLVQLHSTGESRWLPYERLVRIQDAGVKYGHADAGERDSAKRFRLKVLAYALESWNQVTGALDRLDVDPLPHQIDLVHRIMSSDQPNWLIADDVGLGKTIEVGLLLAALKRRQRIRRVLVVCPAGVVRQWQDEMKHKFSEDFLIYGLDFNINQPSHWTSYNQVIVSIDRAKSETHSPVFIDSGDWDVIVFDEAHHLSKIEGQAVTQRYRLAEDLKKLTDRFIFLSGTPHQGKTDQFFNLLMLLRPDLGHRLAHMFTDPSAVAEVILRNRKTLVTDANGSFLFRGQDTRLVQSPLSESARDFDKYLQTYLKYGYNAARLGGTTGRAIGFVMTTYRKLASSSIVAIERALQRRLARLQGMPDDLMRDMTKERFEEISDAFREGTDGLDDLGDLADDVTDSNIGISPFFEDEQRQILDLLKAAKIVRHDDRKLSYFLSAIVDHIYKSGKKLLIFTEYRATQEYLIEALRERYRGSGIVQINGSMSLKDKRDSINEFNGHARFMVSTEAGGEGINLHNNCHILVNYDLPWNPRRLVQRTGRLYRYGQQERVIVFNLVSDDGFDNKALSMMLQRVFNIAGTLSKVGSDFNPESLESEIIGELLERVDIAAILAENRDMDISRTEAEIEEAIARARDSRSQQEKLFAHIESYDPNAIVALYTFGPNDVLTFLEGILPYKGIRIRNRLSSGRVLELELPEDMRGRFSEFPSRRTTVVRITVDRQLSMQNSNLVPMDFESKFFSDLINFAKSPAFGGEYTSLNSPESGVLGLYKIRWQNDQGIPTWDTLLPVFLPLGRKRAISNPRFFGNLLIERSDGAKSLQPCITSYAERKSLLNRLEDHAHAELALRCSPLRHPNDVTLLAAADLIAD